MKLLITVMNKKIHYFINKNDNLSNLYLYGN